VRARDLHALLARLQDAEPNGFDSFSACPRRRRAARRRVARAERARARARAWALPRGAPFVLRESSALSASVSAASCSSTVPEGVAVADAGGARRAARGARRAACPQEGRT
jgi:hypothetical protein